MLADFVEQLANAPGNAASFPIAPVTGARTFSAAFGTGEFYAGMSDGGSLRQVVRARVTAGSPDTFTILEVLENSQGGTTRLAFSGAVRVYSISPARRQIYADAGNVLQLGGRRAAGLGVATQPSDALRRDGTGWVQIRTDVITSDAAWAVSLPPEFTRFLVEFQDVSPAALSAGMFMRYSIDGGSSYIQDSGAYASRATLATGTGVTPYVTAVGYAPVSAGTPSTTFGALEFSRGGVRPWRAWAHTRDNGANHNFYESSGWCAVGAGDATNVLLGFISQSIAAGRFRLKGAY